MNEIVKNIIVAMLGGNAYGLLEIIWRGRTHWTMYVAGAVILVTFYNLNKTIKAPLLVKCLLGAIIITSVEFFIGIVFNTDHSIWNYSNVPLNILGQICVPFSLLWIIISAVVFKLLTVLKFDF